MKKLGIALIGYGGVARVHAMAYRAIPFHYGLPADTFLPDTPRSNCGSWLACDGGLTADAVIPSTYPFLR